MATYTPFVVLTAAVCALLLLTVFLFKATQNSRSVCVYSTSLILLGQQIWMGVVYYQQQAHFTFSVTTVFPIVSIIFIILALRAYWQRRGFGAILQQIAWRKEKEMIKWLLYLTNKPIQ